MRSTFTGVVVNTSLSEWKEVLSQWCHIVDKWCEMCAPDRPWWHLEVSNAGLIASAAISCGYSALVESSVPKTRRTGRSDLWVQFGREDGGIGGRKGDFVELKISAIHDGIVDLKKFSQAMNDASAIDWPCRRKLGGCLYWLVGDGDDVEVNAVVDAVARETKAEGLAWVFPSSVRDAPGQNGMKAPGVILALKPVSTPDG